jgi:hypothetical protein
MAGSCLPIPLMTMAKPRTVVADDLLLREVGCGAIVDYEIEIHLRDLINTNQ